MFLEKLIKGPKLYYSISPNKTWSGFISGIFLSGYLVSLCLLFGIWRTFLSYFLLVIRSNYLALVGDLFESKLKRLNNKKDSSNILYQDMEDF